MLKLIINADDLGFDNVRNDAILACFEKRQISTATVMVNMPGFEDAVNRAFKNNLQGCIGLHLNFTQGMPLTEDIKKFPNFCNPDGSFNARFHCSKWGRLFLSPNEKRAVYQEAEAQMQRYIKAGFRMMHLDSHHHAHTDPVICKIVCPLAKKLGFRSIRLSRNFMVTGCLKKVYKWYVNNIIRENAKWTSNFFTSFQDVKKFWECIAEKDVVIEMMVHPNYVDKERGEKVLYDFYDCWEAISIFLKRCKDKLELITFSDLERL